MRMKFIALIINLLLFFQLVGQTGDGIILVTIDNENITKEEFVKVYNKNNSKSLSDNKDSLKIQLGQFINFKLKVLEAKDKGMDKTREFISELSEYKQQLAKPFLFDNTSFENLSFEAYQRTKHEVRASHILVRINEFASPEDTLAAYKKAVHLKSRIINGESFKDVASKTSDDPSAVRNGGDLWYVKAFQTPYKFENYLYNGVINKISAPIRTKYGYHIIKITDKRPNPGKLKVAHIMVSVSPKKDSLQIDKAKLRIDSIYQMATQGVDFAELALKYSEDKGTAANKGELPWFGTGGMSHEFENAAINLNRNGNISKPVLSQYGWHIIKKISRQAVPNYEQMQDQIKKMVSNSDRYDICVQNMIKRVQRENNFLENKELDIFYLAVDSTIFEGKWKLPEFIELEPILFVIGDKKYSKYDFAKHLEENQRKMFPIPIKNYVNQQYDEFKNKKIIDFEFNSLSNKNTKYKNMVNEFHDGILLFEIMEKEIWEKAKNDTLGLKQFYKKNLDKYNKFYSADISIFNFGTDTDVKKLKKDFEKYKKKGLNDSLVSLKIKETIDNEFLFIKRFVADENNNNAFKRVVAQLKSGEISSKQKTIIFEEYYNMVYLNTPIAKTKKSWKEYKGILISDYQDYLDNKWIKELRLKHKITIHPKALKSMF
ncbi:MAG: hypothetical protein B6I20_07405 [Bacteroidetes bacterium 4572_117]|nr:MAG: hypothetical protein B6I20_07405 [Bacteroidetes bacterium 4572_117]